jgi:hypothetical protein
MKESSREAAPGRPLPTILDLIVLFSFDLIVLFS